MTPLESDARARAHIKRFLELTEGDPDFREAAVSMTGRQKLLDDAGVDLSAGELGALWELPQVPSMTAEELQAWRSLVEGNPLGRAWRAWNEEQTARRERAIREWVPSDPRVRAWRKRSLSRVRSSAIGENDLDHFPLFAFELTDGCSVQCWFCALDPAKLKSVFAYTPEHRQLWREVLGHAWELCGAACRSTICYHATDPSDNPDYFLFQRDVVERFGHLPQVTTSQPLRDLTWTHELIRLQKEYPETHHRFSVLSIGALRKIFATFTPEELAHIGLVMQHREALGQKVVVGRAAKQARLLEGEIRRRQDARLPAQPPPQTTCECVCGYLVNMVTGSIKLISPTGYSERAPLGYHTHAEGTFRDAAQFRDFVERTIERCMLTHLAPDDPIRFREDVRYQREENGFTITWRFRKQTVSGSAHHGLLGDLIQGGALRTTQIVEALTNAGMPFLQAVSWLDRVYQTGALVERRDDPRILPLAPD